MKLLATMSFIVMASAAQADVVRATVIDVFPLYDNVQVSVPVEECYNVRVPGRSASTGDVLAGAIVGGVIGNQFGSGSGKDAMTILGAIVGADSVNKQSSQSYVEQRCDTYYETTYEERLTGYLVTYQTSRFIGDFVSDYPYSVGEKINVTIDHY